MPWRWSRSSRIYLASSLALALASGVALHSYLNRVAMASGTSEPRIPVVVATKSIARGMALQRDQLRTIQVPKTYAQPGSISSISRAAGRVALWDLKAGEAVTEQRLARVRAGPVASLVPEGLRAFAVPTSLPIGTVTGGDHVDVLATYTAGQPHTETVVAGVEILFVLGPGNPASRSSPKGLDLDAAGSGIGPSTTLIVLVSPDQEERLAFARAFADLQVAIAPPPPAG